MRILLEYIHLLSFFPEKMTNLLEELEEAGLLEPGVEGIVGGRTMPLLYGCWPGGPGGRCIPAVGVPPGPPIPTGGYCGRCTFNC